jgi:hypothetical protein
VESEQLQSHVFSISGEERVKQLMKEFQKIKKEYGSFSNFLGSLGVTKDGEVSRFLIERFKHVGEYTADYYLHCVGYR